MALKEQAMAMGPMKVVSSQSRRLMPSMPTLNLTPRAGIQLQAPAHWTASLARS